MTGAREYKITYRDYLDVRAESPHVALAAPVINRDDIRAVSQYASAGGQLIGTEPQYNQIRFLPLTEGRWINDKDNSEKRQVVVLGDEYIKNLFPANLFPGRTPVGQIITLNGVRFEVIGVLRRVGRGDDNGTNARIFVPFETMRQYFPLKAEGEQDAISTINYSPQSRDVHLIANTEVKKVIARNHHFDWRDSDAFEMFDTALNASMVGKIFDAMNMFLGSVGLVTLALGAIGIINIMLVSVSERTREIGLRKALGATNRTILAQFFLEGIFLTLVSGGIGMAAASGFMALLGLLPSPEGFDTPKLVPASAALAIGSLALAGIVAGLYPARKAAMMAPVEALRQE
jgi:putative ABC transport system permease protein